MYKKSSDKMNELYAACSYWDSEFLGVRQRLGFSKEASVSNKILAGMAGGAAGYYTSDEKSKSSTRLLRAAGGAALGAGGAHLYSKYKKAAPGKPKDLSEKVKELLDKKKYLTDADIKILNKIKIKEQLNKTGPTKQANAALVGAGVLGAVGGIRAYQRNKLSPGQKYTKAEFEAMQSTRALEEKSKAGLKVSILDRKLNDLKVQEARDGRKSLRGAVVQGVTRGAATGALAGYLASRGIK